VAAPAVLIADDDDLLRRLMQRVLETSGHRVLVASNGDDAVSALASAPGEIGVAVLDVLMPPHGALATMARLREIRPGVGIVLTSGLPAQQSVAALVAERRAVFLQKPFAPEALRRAVRVLLAEQAEA
jgi:DNA-binding NtrC family response regulator